MLQRVRTAREVEVGVRTRLAAAIAACLLVLLSGATAAATATASQVATVTPRTAGTASAPSLAADGEALKGTLRSAAGRPVAGASLTVSQGGSDVGTATTGRDGAWQVDLPGPGKYTVSLDVGSLPGGMRPRSVGGQTLSDVTVRPSQARVVIFPLVPKGTAQQGATPSATSSSTAGSDTGTGGTPASTGTGFVGRFLQLFVEGIKLGAIIAITAVGLSLVFGTTRLINFAHGELVTIGAMTAFFFSVSPFTMPLVLAAVLAVGVGGLAGGAMERVLWRPLRRRGAGLIQMFIISIGLSLLLRHLLLVLFGSRRQTYRDFTVQQNLEIGPIAITPRDLVVTLLSGLVILGVAFMLQRTRIGKAMRAVSDNRDLAESSGIDVDRVVLIVWVVGGALAALGGVFYGLTQAVYWDMGFNLLLLMFAGVILGGLGSAYGAVVGSLVVGLVAQLSTLWFPTELQNAWALLALIVVLLVRPQGILGQAERAG